MYNLTQFSPSNPTRLSLTGYNSLIFHGFCMLFTTISSKSSHRTNFECYTLKVRKKWVRHKQVTVYFFWYFDEWLTLARLPHKSTSEDITRFCLQAIVLITKCYSCFFRINLDTKLQFGNVYHCGQQTAIHLNQLSQKSHCCHRYCSHRYCHLCSHHHHHHHRSILGAGCSYPLCPDHSFRSGVPV